jgi:hypothetical protein
LILAFLTRNVRVGSAKEIDLSHSPLPVGLGDVTVMRNHPGLLVAKPLADVRLGNPVREALRTEEMSETVQAAVLEAGLVRARRESLLELVDDFPDEDVSHGIGLQSSAARTVEDPTVGMMRHGIQDFEKLRMQRQRTVPTPLESAGGADPPLSRTRAFVRQPEKRGFGVQ